MFMSDNYTITDSLIGYVLNIDVNIEEEAFYAEIKNLNELIIQISKHVFEKLSLNEYVNHIEFSLTLADEDFITQLNSQYRHKNQPTNCLSFPAQEIIPDKLKEFKFHNGFAVLGDIILAYKVVKKESNEQNKNFVDHFTHLIIHSILHLLGYDHEIEKEALIMEALEIEILSFFNIKSPYENFN